MSDVTPASILDGILAGVGEAVSDGAVRFHGRDPVLATPFRIGELGAAAVGAAALQTARLLDRCTEISQRIDVEVDAAAAGMRSSRYLTVDPPLANSHQRPVRYRTRDGSWIVMQRLFPQHVARQLEVLGCDADADEEQVEAAAAEWDALALEEAIIANGAVAGAVRSHEEWAAHPQSAAVGSLPLIEITRIGDSNPIPIRRGDRPLSGIRVLDVTRVLAGPTCARTLAEQGADVLRISSPRVPDNLQMLMDTGHGKRSTLLDLRTAAGLEILCGLIREADVFSQGYRPGALANLGLSPAEVAAIRPGIVYVTFSAYGRLGPWNGRRGFDSVVQSVTGLSDEMGGGGAPLLQPANPLDYTMGYLGAFGALVALGRRAREGGSYHVELSLARTGRELDRLPRADREIASARPLELPPERLDEIVMSRSTPFGVLRYLTPVARLSATPAHWERPSVPADYDEPRWL